MGKISLRVAIDLTAALRNGRGRRRRGAERATSLPIALPKEGAAMCGESARCPVTFILFLPDLAHLVGKCMPRTLKAASQ